jgi:hypothetical protein
MEAEGRRAMNYTKQMEVRHAAYPGDARKARSDVADSRGETFVKNAAWTMAVGTLIGVGLLMLWLGPPRMHSRPEEAWKAEFAEAEHARESGDRYRALEMYIHSARIAASADDWRAQLTIASGLEKLGKTEGPSLYGFNVIVSAMESAERQKSAEGMRAVADAFSSLGTSYASFALSRIQTDWAH